MSIAEKIDVKHLPATLEVNFVVLKEALEKDLEKYDVVVTEDTLAGAKQLAADLNKVKKTIADKRKEVVSHASEPIKQFEGDMKSLEALCDNGRGKLIDQIAEFEDKKRDLAKEKLTGRLKMEWDQLGVTEEFRKAAVDDLVKLTALTKSGNLTASAEKDVKARAMDDKQLQDQTDRRLLELENQSYKVGLMAPLSRDHVLPFLFDDDEKYQKELERIFAVEIERQRAAEQKMNERMARQEETRREVSREFQKPEPPEAPKQEEPPPQDAPPAKPDSLGRIPVDVQCTFQISVPPNATEEAIESQLRKKLAAAGFTTLSSVYIRKQKVA